MRDVFPLGVHVMSTPRIMLCFAGGEITLFTYKRAIGDQQVSEKLMSIANAIFPTWSWGTDIHAIEGNDCILMAVTGPGHVECHL